LANYLLPGQWVFNFEKNGKFRMKPEVASKLELRTGTENRPVARTETKTQLI
jgi:hypothetical protein